MARPADFSFFQARAATIVVLSLGLAALAEGQSLPAGYDLRSVLTASGSLAWVPAVQDQGDAEDCWTFATATAINSNLQRNGWLPTAAAAPTIQVSSWHLSTRNGAPDQLEASDAFGNNSNWGADSMGQALGYLTRGPGTWNIPNAPANNAPANATTHIQQMGGGVVLDSAPVAPSNAFPASIANSSGYPSNLGSLIPPASQTPAYRVTRVLSYDQGFGNNPPLPTPSGTKDIGGTTYNTYAFTQGAADPQVGVVKQAILAQGAATTWMNADYNDFTFVPNPSGSAVDNTVNYVNNHKATGYSDHSVTIIGWDDTYQITKGDTTYMGAWLVQNSWGKSDWTGNDVGTNDGTFWAPYDDAVIGRSGVNAFQATPQNAVAVLQNELGPMDYSDNYAAAYGNNQTGAANPLLMATSAANQVASRLTPTESGFLAGVGVATQMSNVTLELTIYGGWLDDAPVDLLYRQDFTLDEGMGYYELGLAQQIALLAGDDIVLQLMYLDQTTGGAMAHAVAVTVGGSGLNGYLDVADGLSFYFDEATASWVDFSSVRYPGSTSGEDALGGILFAKGLVAVPEPSVWAMIALALGLLCVVHVRRKSPRAA